MIIVITLDLEPIMRKLLQLICIHVLYSMFNSFFVQLLIDSSSLTKIEPCHSLPYTFAPTLKRAMAFIIKLYFSLINLLLDENVFFHVQSNNELNI